jgi:arylsulfatase A-like enzyme
MTGRSFLNLLLGQSYEGRKYVFSERGAHGSSLPTNAAAFDLGRVIVGKRYKLIYNAMPDIPYWPVDFAGDAMWQELVAMNKTGKLSAELSERYFSPKRPMFELYDLEYDPAELTNLAGKPDLQVTLHDLKSELARWMVMQRDYVPLPIEKKAGPQGGGKGKGKKR